MHDFSFGTGVLSWWGVLLGNAASRFPLDAWLFLWDWRVGLVGEVFWRGWGNEF